MSAAATVGMGDVGSGGIPGGGMPSGGDAELGSLLGSAFDEASAGGETPPGEAGAEPSQPFETPQDTPAGEQPTLEAQEQPQAQEKPSQPEPIPGWKVSEDGQSYNVPAAELPRVQSALQYSEQVGQYFANPQEALGAYQDASATRQMFNDWMYGTDDAVKSVLQHWAGANQQDPGTKMAFQRSFTRMLQQAPDFLKSYAPDQYNALVSSLGGRVVQSLYDKAGQTGNPQDLLNAQSADWALTGQYKDKAPQADPQEAARMQFEQQRNEFNQRQEAALRRDSDGFNQSSLVGAELRQLNAAIDTQIGKFKDRYSDIAYQDLKAGIRNEIIGELGKQAEWFTEHKQGLDQLMADYGMAWRSGDARAQSLQPRVQAHVQSFMTRVQRLLPSIAAKRVTATTTRVNQATGGKRQSAPAPRPQGQPSQSAPQNGQRQNFDDEWSKFWQRSA